MYSFRIGTKSCREMVFVICLSSFSEFGYALKPPINMISGGEMIGAKLTYDSGISLQLIIPTTKRWWALREARQ